MDNETKYPLVIIGVALLALVTFNYDDLFTGNAVDGSLLQNQPTAFDQEKLNLIRTIDIPNAVKAGKSVNVEFISNSASDLIQINKEKINFYKVDDRISRKKKQLTYPRCIDGRASACNAAEKSYLIPVSWENGRYRVQIEREIKVGEKAVIEIVGRRDFNIN